MHSLYVPSVVCTRISALGRPKQIDFCKLQADLGYGSDFKVSLRYNSNLSLEQNKAPKLQVRASSREKIYNQDIGRNRQGGQSVIDLSLTADPTFRFTLRKNWPKGSVCLSRTPQGMGSR